MRNVFWVLSLGIIAAYGFFFALGAFNFTDSLPLSLTVVALAALWLVHGWLDARHTSDTRDPRLVHARERRGF
jgi:hypothetical protein